MITSKKLSNIINNCYVNLLIRDMIPNEEIVISLKKDFDTACWTFNDDKHSFFIGDSILEKMDVSEVSDETIILSFIAHEMGHAFFTTRDFKYINDVLKKEKIDFQIYNLFEDARIEHLIRTTFGFNFKWTTFWKINEDSFDEKPLETFFKIIQTENKKTFNVPFFEKVYSYYNKTINSRTFEELVKIIKDFIKDFSLDIKKDFSIPLNSSFGLGIKLENYIRGLQNEEEGTPNLSDLELGFLISGDKEARRLFEQGTERIVDNSKNIENELVNDIENEFGIKYLNSVISNENMNVTNSNTNDIFMYKDNVSKLTKKELNKLNKVLLELEKIFFQIDNEKLNTVKPGTQFNIKNIIKRKNGQINAKIYKKQFDEDYKKDKKKIALVLDLSGSMSGIPNINQKIMTIALNRLAKKKLVQGIVIGSKIKKGLSLNQGLIFPFDEKIILGVEANGNAEGIGYAIRNFRNELENKDHIFVFTDGQIHDLDLELIKKDMPQIYKKTFGVYVGEKTHTNKKEMKKWFNQTIIENDIVDLIKEIANIIACNNEINKNIKINIKTKKEEIQNIDIN